MLFNINLVLLIHTLSTWAMVGLIWTIQLVHYPGFFFIDPARSLEFAQFHQSRISLIVLPLMLTELMTGLMLMGSLKGSVLTQPILISMIMLAVIWATTFLISVPCHQKLSAGFDDSAARLLVNSNWIRTLLWTLRGLIVAKILHDLLPAQIGA